MPATSSSRLERDRLLALLRLLRTSTFRLAMVYMALFGGSALVLLAFLYWATAGSLLRQSDATTEAEVEGLAEQYRQRGTAGVATIISERVRRDPSSPSLYLFADARFRPIAGNLSAWPASIPEGGWVEFQLDDRRRGGAVHRARARVFILRGGARLLVGRDMFEIDRLRARMLRATLWGLGVIALLALVGGAAMSRSTLRRIEAINLTSRRIMDGELSQRVPTDGTGDDFDQLAENLNRMLDRIEMLMDGVRRVSDHIAHDLRTPLARVRGRLERLTDALETADPGSGDDGSEARILAGRCLEETDHLLRVFAALLRIARIEAGGTRPPSQRCDLAEVAADAVELYEAAAEAKELRLTLRAAEAIPWHGDRDLLSQALANLLDNAIKYTPVGGLVEVTVAREGGGEGARIAVRDSGPGIPSQDRRSVTERFVRLERDHRSAGEGLGLALVAAVARHHGGRLELGDAHPGLLATLVLPSSAAQSRAKRPTARAWSAI